MRRSIRLLLRATPIACVTVVIACNTVSGTSRSQLNILSPTEERQLGDEAYQEALSEKGVKTVTSGPDYDRVQRVATRIEDASERLHRNAVKDFEWQWTVIDDPAKVNAWALPGGKSAVYTGLLQMAQTDDELAVVMGHEASHAIARHAGERIFASPLARRLAAHLLDAWEAPDATIAVEFARAEIEFALSLSHHPSGTILALEREFNEQGLIERTRVVATD